MPNSTHYQDMRALARAKRIEYSLATPDITLSSVRKIYKKEGITIDSWPGRLRKIKAAYFSDECGCSVLLNMKLPEEPRLFAMLHELKHHYVDQRELQYFCKEVYTNSPVIEIGAEVFAAEFLFPEEEFHRYVSKYIQLGGIKAEHIVEMKYHCPAHASYQFILKTLDRLGYINKEQFIKVQFRKLHQQMYGSPHYHNRSKSI